MTNRFGDALVAAGLTAVCLMAGCALHQPEPGSSKDGAVRVLGSKPAPSSSAGHVRVDSIQRLDGEDGKAVSGVVTVRNISDEARTVRVSVSWINGTGKPIGPDAVSAQSVTLASGESRELRFDGAPGSRDFKVALGAAAN